jgi:hypothetical protein
MKTKRPRTLHSRIHHLNPATLSDSGCTGATAEYYPVRGAARIEVQRDFDEEWMFGHPD